MPYLAIGTNVDIAPEARARFLKEASQAVATGTGKPEQYVMVKLDAGHPMLFAGTGDPAAFLEVKSIGYPTNSIPKLADALCALTAQHFAVPEERIYITFTDTKAVMWGQGGEMFG